MKRSVFKRFLMGALAATALVTLAACGGNNTSEGKGAETAGPAAKGAKGVVMKLSHGLSEEHPIQAALEQFANEVEKNTNGDIKVEIYPNSTLGSEKDSLEQIPIGALDMAKVSAATMETFAPVYGAFSVPYIFNNEEHFYTFMDSDTAKEVYASTADQGFIALTWYDSGARSFYTKGRAINTPADLKGLKIRTMDSPMAFSMMEAFGGSATTMSINDVFTAMQSGVIDGAENNETALTTGGHGEVAKFYSTDEHTRIPDILLISTKQWNSFSKEQQDIVAKAADNSKETYKGN